MTKICEWCKCEFTTRNPKKAKYCSKRCLGKARSEAARIRHRAKAEELGISLDECASARKRWRQLRSGLGWKRGMKRPKSYAEIRAANRRHPIVAGWRGAPVMGGGAGVRHNDPWLKPSEYVR